ncbi:hypothetical protein H8D04_00310 [bacterium]|nr:hypothetical protein [bacterium]
MKQIIKDVLEDMSVDQPNLVSEAARETIASLISAALKTYGEYTKYKLDTVGEPVKPINSYLTTDMAMEEWICDYCGKSTYDVDYEYLVSQTRHLECQLKYERENGEQYTDDADLDWPEERDNIIAQAYMEHSSDGLPEGGDRQAVLDAHRLADEIGDVHEGDWIYESPDGGKTVFRRPIGEYDPKLKEEIDFETKEPTGRLFTEYNNGRWNDER